VPRPVTPYFHRRSPEHGVTRRDVEAALASEVHRETQADGRFHVWGYSPRHGRFLRVVLLADGVTVHNAFPDRNFKP